MNNNLIDNIVGNLRNIFDEFMHPIKKTTAIKEERSDILVPKDIQNMVNILNNKQALDSKPSEFKSKFKAEDHNKVYEKISEKPNLEIRRYKINNGPIVCFLWNAATNKFEPRSNSCNPEMHRYKPEFVDSVSVPEAYENFKKNIAGYWFANAVVDVELNISKKKEKPIELTTAQIKALQKTSPVISSDPVEFKNYEKDIYEIASIEYVNNLKKGMIFSIPQMNEIAYKAVHKANLNTIKELYKSGKIEPVNKKADAKRCKNWKVVG